jgi:hypothetical protein
VSARFYVAWAIAVVLAVVLPTALPRAIWSGSDVPADNPAEEFGRRAIVQVRGHDYAPFFVGLSVDVEEHGVPGSPAAYRAEVTARGPYGIPVESYTVTASDIQRGETKNTALAALALLMGVAFASLPFVVALTNARLRARTAVAA